MISLPQTKKRFGFTLIELLVVISIISLLTTVVIYKSTALRRVAQNTASKSDISEMAKAIEVFKAQSVNGAIIAAIGVSQPIDFTRPTTQLGGDYLIKDTDTHYFTELFGSGGFYPLSIQHTPSDQYYYDYQTTSPIGGTSLCPDSTCRHSATPVPNLTYTVSSNLQNGAQVGDEIGFYITNGSETLVKNDSSTNTNSGSVVTTTPPPPVVTTTVTPPPPPPSPPAPSIHPLLITPASFITDLSSAGNTDWPTYQNYCQKNLNQLIVNSYAGWEWREAVENYGVCYQVLKQSDPGTASIYAKKALEIMKVLARDSLASVTGGGGARGTLQTLGVGGTTTYSLPFLPNDPTSTEVFLASSHEIPLTASGQADQLGEFVPILKISDQPGAQAAYSASDYKLHLRLGSDSTMLEWTGSHRPAAGQTYYVTVSDTTSQKQDSATYKITGNTLTFNTTPAADRVIFVSFMGKNFEQTGDLMGGQNAVQQDGPGYTMRTFNVGLAEGYDYLFDLPMLTADLRSEFMGVLNSQIDWYKDFGYERDGDTGNYFVEGLLNGTLSTAYATDTDNVRSPDFKGLAATYLNRTMTAINSHLPGGFGPQGQYSNGTDTDILRLASISERLTGTHYLSDSLWAQHLVEATIHATKPDHTFYDGGDWTSFPSTPLSQALDSYARTLPNSPSAPFARQLLKELGQPVPAGPQKDYRTAYQAAYLANASGPLYTRSDWSPSAVWLSLSGGPITMDHEHRDQGHISIQRGADYLLGNAGGYDYTSTFPYHNTLGIDDRGAGDISVYPPGQGWWGDGVKIDRFTENPAFTYGRADLTTAFGTRPYNGVTLNSVKSAVRSLIYLRPDIIVLHDRAQSFQTGVKKIINFNFGGPITQKGPIFSATKGTSTLFMKSLIPANPTPVYATITDQSGNNWFNYQQTLTGQTDNTFLNVFQVTDQNVKAMTDATYLNSTDGNLEGAVVKSQTMTWTVLCAVHTSQLDTPIAYQRQNSNGAEQHILTDLRPSHSYHVLVKGGTTVFDQTLQSSDQGLLNFQYTANGNVTIEITPL